MGGVLMPSLAVSQGYLFLMSSLLAARGKPSRSSAKAIQAQACSVPYCGADPFQGAVDHGEFAVDFLGEQD